MPVFCRHALAAAVFAAFFVPAVAHADDDAFLRKAMEGDNSEVAIGKLAQTHSATPAVRAYGRMLIHDHEEHRLKVAALGRKMGVHATMALGPEGVEAEHMLCGMHGAPFDAAFKHHMVEDHEKDIADYQAEVSSAQSPRVRRMAQETLPTLHKHLDGAKAL